MIDNTQEQSAKIAHTTQAELDHIADVNNMVVDNSLDGIFDKMGYTKNTDFRKEAIRLITDWHTRKLNEAILEEWALISEVVHSANITAELFIGKAREDRLAELDTINAGESNENIRLTQEPDGYGGDFELTSQIGEEV